MHEKLPSMQKVDFYTPANFVCGGVYCFQVVRPAVRASVRNILFS